MEKVETIQIEKPGPPAVVAELSPIVKAALKFEVVDVASHGIALERHKTCVNAKRAITEHFEPARKAADSAKKEVLALRDGFIGPISEAGRVYDRKAGEHERAEEAKALEEERRLQEIARKEEEDRQINAAIDAEAVGDDAAAAEIMDETPEVPVITVAPQVAKVEGSSKRKTWSAEVTDLQQLVRYVSTHPEWISLLEPAMPNLNRMAVSQREALRIPGVRAVSKSVRATRG